MYCVCEFVGRVPVFTITSRSAIEVANDPKVLFSIHLNGIPFKRTVRSIRYSCDSSFFKGRLLVGTMEKNRRSLNCRGSTVVIITSLRSVISARQLARKGVMLVLPQTRSTRHSISPRSVTRPKTGEPIGSIGGQLLIVTCHLIISKALPQCVRSAIYNVKVPGYGSFLWLFIFMVFHFSNVKNNTLRSHHQFLE